jgi:hypothetical protein
VHIRYYANMTNMYVCPAAASNCDSTPPPPCYDGVCYCHLFQHEWTEEEAYCHGYLPMWANPDATVIAGTDATQTGEFPMKDDIQVFISDLYRSSKLKYFGDKDDFHGITLRRYGIDPIDLENAFANVSQADFFQWGYKGMENMSVAAGLPLFATKPHFLDGVREGGREEGGGGGILTNALHSQQDPDLVNGVAGMNPSEDAHDTYVDFEPITGVAFRAAKRLQVRVRASEASAKKRERQHLPSHYLVRAELHFFRASGVGGSSGRARPNIHSLRSRALCERSGRE